MTAAPGQSLTLGGSWSNTAAANLSATNATLSLNGTWSNAAGSAITATSSTLNLGNAANVWSNLGTITATNSTVNLGGSFTLAGLGSFTRSGGIVNLTGALNNTGTTLAFTTTTGSWNLVGGNITGGTVTEAAGAELTFTGSNGTLAGVTFNNNLDLASVYGADVTVTGGLTLNGATVDVGNAAGSTWGQLYFSGTQTLGGSGTVLFGKSGNNGVYETAGASTLTIGSGITVRGSSGTISSYSGNSTVVNQGTISADDSGGLTTPFVYDTDFSGGSAASTTATISTAGVTNPAPRPSTRLTDRVLSRIH